MAATIFEGNHITVPAAIEHDRLIADEAGKGFLLDVVRESRTVPVVPKKLRHRTCFSPKQDCLRNTKPSYNTGNEIVRDA